MACRLRQPFRVQALHSKGLMQPTCRVSRPPPENSTCNGQPQPLVAGTLLFPVGRLGTVYQLQYELRLSTLSTASFARRLKALNDMLLQRV